ncbi:MAG: hypothetical protein HUU54_12570 [Ignavibacteriaceae bacterium]|nr:hypothetical protein [Ignavibacteriaceae bacterium]
MKYKVPFSYRLISTDFAMRTIALWMYSIDVMHVWFFWLSQLLMIPLLSSVIMVQTNTKNKWIEHFRKKHNLPENMKIHLDVEGSAFSALFVVFIVGIGTFIAFSLLTPLNFVWQTILTTLTFLLYGFYNIVLFLVSFSPLKSVTLEKDSALTLPLDHLTVDGNDKELVKQEILLMNYSQKVDTYTIESALLGALAFTCFLSILQIDRSVINNIPPILNSLSIIANNIIAFNFTAIITFISDLHLNFTTVMALLAIESLVCSLLYLLVIVARIRFHDVLRYAEYEVRVAREFNNKEEEYSLLASQGSSDTVDTRIRTLNDEINKILTSSMALIKQLGSIINYMNRIRIIALFIFVLIISTAASLITYVMGILFLSLYVLSVSYHKIDTWAKNKSLSSFSMKIFSKL